MRARRQGTPGEGDQRANSEGPASSADQARPMSPLRHLSAIVLLPVMACVVIPLLIVLWAGPQHVAWNPPVAWGVVLRVSAIALAGCGLWLLVSTTRLLSSRGRGTLAPWDPPQELVTDGIYRHMRNPMISGVCCILLAELLLFLTLGSLAWLLAFIVANLIYIPLVEEKALERRFGQRYVRYKRNVPRWVPRRHPSELPD